jgi:hypothetical protein
MVRGVDGGCAMNEQFVFVMYLVGLYLRIVYVSSWLIGYSLDGWLWLQKAQRGLI